MTVSLGSLDGDSHRWEIVKTLPIHSWNSHAGSGVIEAVGLVRPKTLASLVVIIALLGTAGVTGASTRDPWAALHRPLRLKPLPAGATCPVSPTHSLDRGHLSGVGRGPIYPMPTPVSAYDRRPGWLGSKTIWAWPENLRSHAVHVLVRGIRLDRPGGMRFELGPQWGSAPLTAELHIDTSRTVGSYSQSRWGTTVTMLLVRAPGCYGLQLDSERGTSTIVLSGN
jgi:hypothetical protein